MEFLYVCLFSNGHIKVGRSLDPTSRMAAHAERVACMGVDVVETFSVACSGAAAPSELELIGLCAASPGATRYQSEWFSGLDFETVCDWSTQCASREHAAATPSALRQYLDGLPRGGFTQFAKDLGIAKAYLGQLASGWGGREPPVVMCVRIERLTGGQVTRRELRTDWIRIWPELDE